MRVAVADDAMITREGLVRLLQEAGMEVVAEAQDGDELLRKVAATHPDAAIVDIRMPPTNTDEGLVAANAIRSQHPDVAVLILSSYIEPRYAMALLQEHPERVGYLLKDRVFDIAVLVDALRRLAEGSRSSIPRSSRASLAAGVRRARSMSSPRASATSSSCWPKACPTARSLSASSSRSAQSRPTSSRSFRSSISRRAPTPTAASSPCSPTYAADSSATSGACGSSLAPCKTRRGLGA
jgi:DNA-binding NarL/FixJ family response regulator